MARRTFTEVDTYLGFNLGNRGDVTSTMRGHWINDALSKVANEYEHPELEGIGDEILVLETDVITPTVITDLWWPVMVKDATTGRMIRPGERERIENILNKSTGPPTR